MSIKEAASDILLSIKEAASDILLSIKEAASDILFSIPMAKQQQHCTRLTAHDNSNAVKQWKTLICVTNWK